MALLSIPDRSGLLPPLGTLLTSIPDGASGVVVGPPGSGKTVLAVHLARRAAEMGPAVLLVNSDHLVRWLLRASPELPTGLTIGTWRTWLTRIHGECTGRPLPVSWRDDRRQYDWPTIEQALHQAEPPPRRIFLDEAQDIPVQPALGGHVGH